MVERLIIDFGLHRFAEALFTPTGDYLFCIFKDKEQTATFQPTDFTFEVGEPLKLFYNSALIYSSDVPVLSTFRLL